MPEMRQGFRGQSLPSEKRQAPTLLLRLHDKEGTEELFGLRQGVYV